MYNTTIYLIMYNTDIYPILCNPVTLCWSVSSTLVHNLLQLCSSLQAGRPELGRRMLAEKYSVTASWSRGRPPLAHR